MFFLRSKQDTNTTILIIVRYKGQRYKFPTGESIPSSAWLHESQRCKVGRAYPDGADVNERLEIWEKHVKTALNNFSLKFMIPTQDQWRDEIKRLAFGIKKEIPTTLVEFAKKFKQESDRLNDTKKAYQTSINWLEAYEKHTKKPIRFHDVNEEFYEKFKQFVFSSGVNSPNFFGALIKNVKVFMNNSRSLHGITTHTEKGFKKVSVESDHIYLTVDELIRLHQLTIDPDLIEQINTFQTEQFKNKEKAALAFDDVRNRFLLGAFTGLRVSDFSRVESINFEDGMIRIRTKKTDQPVIIPVHWIIKEMISRGVKFDSKIADQTINEKIKILCRVAGIDAPVRTSTFVRGKRVEIVRFKYELVTTHTARRSAATNMYKAGIPSISIMKITGHNTEKNFLKYIKITQQENAELLAQHPFFKPYS